MKIEKKEYLDYSDVLIKPMPTTIASRQDVNLYRTTKAGKFIPIIVSNMDHTGTIEMAAAVQSHGLLVALHKFYGFK
jgi:GMP reductase